MHLVIWKKHELRNHKIRHYYPLKFVFVLLFLDTFSLSMIIFVYSVLCFNKKTSISCTFSCMYYPVFGLIKTKDTGSIAASGSDGEPTGELTPEQATGEQATEQPTGELDMFSEYKVWLVLCGFIAPFICLLSHVGFIVVAWVSDPEHAWSSALRTLFSFLFFFFMFRQSYVRFNYKPYPLNCVSLMWCISFGWLCSWCQACCCNDNSFCPHKKIFTMEEMEPLLNITEQDTKEDKVESEEIHFNFKAFFISGVLGIFIAGIQALIIFSFIELPFSTDTAPSYILNIMQLAFLVIAAFIAYKVIVLHKPTEISILERVTGILKYLKQPNGGPEEQPNGVPEEQPNGVPEEQPNGVPEEQPNGVPEEQPNGGLQQQPNGGPQQQPNGGPQQQPNGGPQQQPNGGPEEQPNGGPQQQPNGGPEEQLNGGPQQQPNGGPQDQQQPNGGPEQQPNGGPEQQPNGGPQQQPNGVPEQQPNGNTDGT